MAIPFVQANSAGYGNSVAQRTLAFLSNVTKGNLLLAAVPTFNAAITITPTDTQGNVYTQIGSYVDDGVNDRISLWWAVAGSTGANTFQFTPSATAYSAIAIVEYQLLNGKYYIDQNNSSSSGSNVTAFTTGSVPVVNDGELLVGFFGFSATLASASVPSNENIRTQSLTGNTQCGAFLVDSLAQGAAAITATSGTAATFTGIGASIAVQPQPAMPPPKIFLPFSFRLARIGSSQPTYATTPADAQYTLSDTVVMSQSLSFNPGLLASGRRPDRPGKVP